MKKIRKGVFETNSSSTHSISISIAEDGNKIKLDTLPLDEDGVCRIHQDEFGWEHAMFNSPTMKAAYAYTYAKDDIYKMARLGRVIGEQTKASIEFEEGDGYIDHQSYDVCEEAFKDDETLKRFIFSPMSFFKTGNDNC